MLDIADHPDPAHDPALVAVVLVDGDDPDDFAIDVDDEVVAARTEFSWTVRFTVSGTWVADGFDLDHERAMDMLRHDLAYAEAYEVSAQVLEAPPPITIRAMQGGRCDDAKAGQAVLDGLLAAEVTRLRADIAARDRGEIGVVEEADATITEQYFQALASDAARLATEPEEVTAKRYQDMLEVLPPARWIGGAFLVGEAMSHDDNGQARYAYYFRRGDKHFHGPDLTIAEFEAKHDEPITGHGRGQE